VNILVLVFAKVVYGIDSVFLEIREGLEKLCDIHGGQTFERCMGRMGKSNRMNQCFSSLCRERTWISVAYMMWKGEVDWKRTTEWLTGNRRSARPNSSTA
jgi:hypothetical protein